MNHESEDYMSAADNLAAAVVKMLSVSYTHKEINDLVRKTVLDQAAELPSRRVLYNDAHGGFGFSDRFMEKITDDHTSSREDPLIIRPSLISVAKSARNSPLI